VVVRETGTSSGFLLLPTITLSCLGRHLFVTPPHRSQPILSLSSQKPNLRRVKIKGPLRRTFSNLVRVIMWLVIDGVQEKPDNYVPPGTLKNGDSTPLSSPSPLHRNSEILTNLFILSRVTSTTSLLKSNKAEKGFPQVVKISLGYRQHCLGRLNPA
jgi:hypothetical protein